MKQARWWLATVAKCNPWLTAVVICCTLVGSLVPAVNVYVLGTITTQLAEQPSGNVGSGVQVSLAVLLGVMFVAFVLGLIRDLAMSLMEIDLRRSMTTRILSKAACLHPLDSQDPQVADKVYLAAAKGGPGVFGAFQELVGAASGLVSLVALFAVLSTWNPWIAVLLLLAPVPVVLANQGVGRLGVARGRARAGKERKLTYLSGLFFSESSLREILAFDASRSLLAAHAELSNACAADERALTWTASMRVGASGLFSVSAMAGAVAMAGAAALSQGAVGAFVGTISSISAMQSAVQTLYGRVSALVRLLLPLQNVVEFLSLPERTLSRTPSVAAAPAVEPPAGAKRSASDQAVALDGVTFTYPGAKSAALRHVTLSVAPGEFVALVGENGSGKSTLLKVASGLYAADQGQILLGGQDVGSVAEPVRSATIACAFQDFTEFALTVRQNVDPAGEMGDPAVWSALRAVGLGEAVEVLSDGLDTMLGKQFEGIELSHGQWQRLSLARAFGRETPVLFLDEPTASVDAVGETDIVELLKQRSWQTRVMVTHRLRTAALADRIVVLLHGEVVEQGTHEQLSGKGGAYWRLLHAQSEHSVAP